MIYENGQLYINIDGKEELIGFAEDIEFSLEPFINTVENVVRAMGTIVGTIEKMHINTKELRKLYHV